jgi:hypothetical protein
MAYSEHVIEQGFPSFGIDDVLDYASVLELLQRTQATTDLLPFTTEDALLLYAGLDVCNKLLVTEEGEQAIKDELNSVVKDITGLITETQFLNFRTTHTAVNLEIMDLLKTEIKGLPQFTELNKGLAGLRF